MTGALVVAPHPDDAELSAWALLGAPATILCLTHGRDARGEEARRAAKLHRSELIQLDLPDGHLAATPALIDTIAAAIAAAAPAVVAGPPSCDEHQDHRAAAAALRSATRRTALTVVEYETPSTPPGWHPDTFLPLELVDEDMRALALAEHTSQAHHPYMRPDVLRARSAVRGQRIGHDWAEAYRTVRRATI